MGVTWIDTPGATLTSSDAVDFTLTADPIAISVQHGATEERAYRDGAFVAPYLESSKVGLTFALRRTGGWAYAPTVYVDEATPYRDVLYEVNFTTLPNQALVSGANTIDGKSWWLKGPLGGDVFDVLGGLRLRSMENTGIINYSTGAMTRGVLYMPYSQLEGYDPARLSITQCWWQSYSLAYPGNAAGHLSLFSCAHSAAAVTDAERTGVNVSLYDLNAPNNAWRYIATYPGSPNGNIYVNTAHTFSTPANREVLSIVDVQAGRSQVTAADRVATPGTWPSAELQSLARLPLPRGASASPASGLAVWVQNTLGTAFGLQTFVLGGFRVLQ